VLFLGDHILVCHAVTKMPDDEWLGVRRDDLVVVMKWPAVSHKEARPVLVVLQKAEKGLLSKLVS